MVQTRGLVYVCATLALGAAGGCSCAHSTVVGSPMIAAAPPSPNLVMPSPELMAMGGDWTSDPDPGAWEFSRNDGPAPVSTVIASWQSLEVRQREYLNVVNGQPGEFSTIITRSTKRALSR